MFLVLSTTNIVVRKTNSKWARIAAPQPYSSFSSFGFALSITCPRSPTVKKVTTDKNAMPNHDSYRNTQVAGGSVTRKPRDGCLSQWEFRVASVHPRCITRPQMRFVHPVLTQVKNSNTVGLRVRNVKKIKLLDDFSTKGKLIGLPWAQLTKFGWINYISGDRSNHKMTGLILPIFRLQRNRVNTHTLETPPF